MIDRANQLSVADCTLIRHCLLHYDGHLCRLTRNDEAEEVSISVVNTLETLRRLETRLRNWIEAVDMRLHTSNNATDDNDELPF